MLAVLWRLTWVEIKIFLREPMGVIATLVVPVVIFVVLGRSLGAGELAAGPPQVPFNIPILAALLLCVSAVISLVAVIAIYREGGVLKRLRSTPLSPVTILAAHVLVKIIFTVVGLALLVLVGRQVIPGAMDVNMLSFTLALLLSTLSILSLGFLIASVVPTARFAQPITAALFYPMIAVSGLFFPLDRLSRPLEVLALGLPTTHAVALMQGIWEGSGWRLGSTVALVAFLCIFIALSSKVFRWE